MNNPDQDYAEQNSVWSMVPILDGKSEHVAHAWRHVILFRETNPGCDFSRSNQMP